MGRVDRASCPGYVSPPVTLINQLQEIVSRPGFDPEVRCLALIHGSSCIGRFDAVEALYELALGLGIARLRLEETALQVVSYGGFPRAIAGLAILRRVSPGDPIGSIPADEDPARRIELGSRVWNAIYGRNAEEVVQTLESRLPGLSTWVLEDAYGRVLARPGLSLAERELLAVSALGLCGLSSPLESHIRGALRNGSTPGDVEDILRSSRPLGDTTAHRVVDLALDRLSRKVYQ
jgi:4-carboxymuconolactone decarboxylase